jgi:HEAT repeat protein
MEADGKGLELSEAPEARLTTGLKMIDPLDATHDRLRLAVARALKTYPDCELLEGLRDRDPIFRTAAARELHARGGALVFEEAKALAGSERHDFREIGAFVLGQLGTPTCPFAAQSFPILFKLLDDPYFEVQAVAVGAIGFLASLGHLAPAAVFKRVLQLSQAKEPEVRAAVASTLGFFDAPEAAQVLRTLCNDGEGSVSDAADFALELHSSRMPPAGAR